MSLHCGFLFPKKQFHPVFLDTIGYISDNTFYRINLATHQTQIVKNEVGRSYQAIATNHKKGLIVLAEYSSYPTLSFDFFLKPEKSFSMGDICQLQIKSMELSLDCKYLLVTCGLPNNNIAIVDVEKQQCFKGVKSKLPLQSKGLNPVKIQFNPNNSKVFAIMYPHQIQIFQMEQRFQKTSQEADFVQETICISRKGAFAAPVNTHFQTFIWDQINDIYVSNGRNVTVYSTDTFKEVVAYEIQHEEVGVADEIISTFILTQKHLIIFYVNGRIQWLRKYLPDLMEEQEAHLRPFYLDNFYEIGQNVNYAHYDHNFKKIFIALTAGYFCILPKEAQKMEADQGYDDAGQPVQQIKKGGQKRVQIQKHIIGPYHTRKIIFVKEIEGTSVAMTVSTNGRIIFWSLKQKRSIGQFMMNRQLSSVDVNHYCNVLAAGSKDGVVQFYSISNMQNVFLFKQFQLSKGSPLERVSFSSKSQELAILCQQQKKIFYILTHLSMDFSILGYCNINHSLYDICWNINPKIQTKPKFQYLIVNIGYGILMINSPPPVPTKKRGKQLQIDSQIYALRTDLDQNLVCCLPGGQILTTGQNKMLLKYKQPEDPLTKVDFKAKTNILPPVEQIQSHDLPTVCFSIGKNYFVSGGEDGGLQIRSFKDFNNITQIRAFGWKDVNLSVVHASNIYGIFYSCGNDGSLYVWGTSEDIKINQNDVFEKDQVKYPQIEPAGKNIKYYQQIIEENYLNEMRQQINKKKKVQFERINKIKIQLKQLLQENAKHDQLQRLERDQFAIDLESRQKVAQIGRQKCLKIREDSKRSILQKEVYAKKLKQLTWNKMKVHLRAINGLKNNYVVYNYQIRKRGKEQQRKINLVLELRKLQKRQLKKRNLDEKADPQFYKNKNVVNGGVNPTLILTTYEKKDQKKDQKAKKKKEQEIAQKQQPVEDVQNDQEWGLLYSSFQLFSDNSKRNQIIMMKNIIIKIKQVFNAEFNKLQQFRQNQNQIISDKNKRIVQICEELKRPNEIINTNKNVLQNPDVILQVKPSDISFKRYLSKQQRQKLEKERLKEEQRLRLLAEDDSSQRALQKMMGGTLEEKKTSVLEVIVQRQKWMDKPQQEMNQQQKMKMKQYEVKRKKAQQQKQRIVKKLQAELRKLKQQIDDIMDKYDQKLFVLLKRRIEYDYRIEEQQLYCAKLALSMVNFTENCKRKQVLQKKIEEQGHKLKILEEERGLLQERQQQYRREKQSKRVGLDSKKLGDHQSKVKTVEKNVFEEYGNNVKRRRQLQQKMLQKDQTAKYQLLNLDPMHEIQSRYLSQQKAKDFSFFVDQIKRILQQNFVDYPQAALLQMIQTRFNIRKEQAEIDRKIKSLRNSFTVDDQQIENKAATQGQNQEEINYILNQLEKAKSDLEIQCRVKQGQVQLSGQSLIPALDDALLIAKSQIDSKNQAIMSNADQKIKVMQKIKTCKISVTEQTLNLQRKEQLINQLSSMIKQIQMLKVKKQMQVALSKKDSKMNENQLKSLKSRIQDVRKQGQKRINLFEKKIQQIDRQIDTIQKQNKQLQVQKYNLQNTVKQREKIKDMMVGQNGQGNQQATQKFEQIAINRKLFDKAKQQTQEIQLLREELSKLKAKTFANFSNVQR